MTQGPVLETEPDLLGPRAWGVPPMQGHSRVRLEDFGVEEVLGFEPEGAGPHWLIEIEKRDQNTGWVAQALARWAGVPRKDVGHSGLKDRRAVTRQWLSLPAGEAEPNWAALNLPGVRVLRWVRHRRKLRPGSHHANRFRLILRGLQGDWPAWEAHLDRVRQAGFPNYFGTQRFGHAGGNLHAAHRWLFPEAGDGQAAPRSPSREKRSLYLSAVRSLLFNRVLAARVADGSWQSPWVGEPLMWPGSRGFFVVTTADWEEAAERVAAGAIHPSGPLWGGADRLAQAACRAYEDAVLAAESAWCERLEGFGMEAERRALRVIPEDLRWAVVGPAEARVEVTLPRGVFATALLREVLQESPDA